MRRLADILTDGGVNLAGWQLFEARGISADGRYIVGSGSNPQGHTEAWLVDLGARDNGVVPEPASLLLWLGASSCLGLAAYRRRRRGKSADCS